MNIKPIKNNNDYKKALSRIEKIWNAKEGTKTSDELEILSVLIEKYEEDRFALLPPDPIEAIKFRMEQMGLEKKDLAEIIGANRSSEILHGKRTLTLKMIRDLHSALKIPIDSLVGL
jgi:HTH-type transcriptional regulator/antitoxin HigA